MLPAGCVSYEGHKVEADCQPGVNWKKGGLLICCVGSCEDVCSLNCG